jgi:hypothetical protein
MDPNTPLTIAAARYKTRPEAVKAFETCWGAHHQGLFDHMALAVLTKGEDGQLEVERHDTTTKHLAWAGVAVGAALTVVFPPAGIAALAVAGGAGAGVGAWIGHFWNTIPKDEIQLGTKIGALVGLGIEGEEGMEAGAIAGAEEVAAEGGVHVFTEEEEWDVLEEIPNDSAAALILLEHHWAVPLRDAIARAGGFRISDGFISPLDLVGIGLISAEEASELHAMETSGAAS